MPPPTGGLKLWAGSIASHRVLRPFLDRERSSDTRCPFHRPTEVPPDDPARLVEPETAEREPSSKFIIRPLRAERTVHLRVDPPTPRPVKNADGARNGHPKFARQAIVICISTTVG